MGFARALELDPQFAMAMIGLARNSEPDQQVLLVKRAARERDRLTPHERLHVDLSLADIAHDKNRFTEIAREIHKEFPDDLRVAGYLAGDEMKKGNFERSLQIFGEVLAIDPNIADAYNQIGYYYGYHGDYEKAILNLKKYQFMAPDQANPYDSLGEIQAYSGHYDEALENLQKAIALKPDFFESYGHMAVAYEGKGDYPKAIAAFTRASAESVTDGSRVEFLLRAFRVAALSGDVAQARELAKKAEALPHDKSYEEDWQVGSEFGRAVLLAAEGQPAKAEQGFLTVKPKWNALFERKTKGSGMKPYWPYWNFMIARTKAAQGKIDEAIVLDEEMANPPNPWSDFESRRWVYEGRAALAQLVARKGDLERADKLLAENHKWNPNWAPTRPAELAVAQMHRENVQAATK